MPSTATGLRRQVLSMTPLPAAAEIERRRPVTSIRARTAGLRWCFLMAAAQAADTRLTRSRGRSLRVSLRPNPYSAAQSKTARFLEIVERHHGPFATIDPADVGTISRQRAHEADLDTGSARSALRRQRAAPLRTATRHEGAICPCGPGGHRHPGRRPRPVGSHGAALLLALVLGLFHVGKWAFWPRHELPRHRVRHLRLRLFFRLHPGRGHATLFELWRHWSSRASAQKDRYARP